VRSKQLSLTSDEYRLLMLVLRDAASRSKQGGDAHGLELLRQLADVINDQHPEDPPLILG
jgi:hypothetical protein